MAMSGSPPPAGGRGDDWTAQVADTIESVVTAVRDKTTKPVITVARGVVYGLVAAVLGVAVLILFTITVIRLLDLVMPVWLAYLVLGGIFLLLGRLVWGRAWARAGS